MRAFVLGAGLGKRLRPLTNRLPKPLIPVWHRPLIAWAFDHLRSIGAREFVVNTHHLPEAFGDAFPDGTYRDLPVQFRHEPILLETGGGLANVWDLLVNAGSPDQSFAVYNGDILCDAPLDQAWRAHQESGNLVTLVLREDGATRNVAFDSTSGRVLDLRNALGMDHSNQVQFTGIYFVHPAFYRFLRPGAVESVVEAFLRAIQAGERIGGCLVRGDWWDLGDPVSYAVAHAALRHSDFPRYGCDGPGPRDIVAVHPKAVLADGVHLAGATCIGFGANLGQGVALRDCVVWPNTTVPAHTVGELTVFG